MSLSASRVLTLASLISLAVMIPQARARSRAELKREAEAIQVQLDQAKELRRSGQYVEAAALFERIASEHPKHVKGQRAAIEAAKTYDLDGQIDKALQQLDRAAERGTSDARTVTALYEKALICERLGRTPDAIAALDQLRVCFPESERVPDALELKGRIQHLSAEQIDALKAREHEAAELLAQARAKLRSSTERREVPELVSRIESQYPDTSSAIAVLAVKAELLHIANRFQEARTVGSSSSTALCR